MVFYHIHHVLLDIITTLQQADTCAAYGSHSHRYHEACKSHPLHTANLQKRALSSEPVIQRKPHHPHPFHNSTHHIPISNPHSSHHNTKSYKYTPPASKLPHVAQRH